MSRLSALVRICAGAISDGRPCRDSYRNRLNWRKIPVTLKTFNERDCPFAIATEYNQSGVPAHVRMDESDQLKQLSNEVLAKGPFPTEECRQARISAAVHDELVLYLADIAGLASRGEQGLVALSESERAKFRKLASRGISTRVPEVAMRITPQATPELHALVEATEQARLLILKALESQLAQHLYCTNYPKNSQLVVD